MMDSVFRAPYSAWSAEQILTYFRSRSHIKYFPVLDEEQTGREKIDDVLANRFTFNGESYPLPSPFDWQVNPSPDVEWLILLHKFYYAAGLGVAYSETREPRYAAKWIELTASWIKTVPLGFLPSDVAGRRIQNWIFAHYYFVTCDPTTSIAPDFYLEFLASLAQQVNHLCDHLTPARNHRTLELAAVFLAAVVFPEFQDADSWLDLSKRELLQNIQADILPDGVHCELSTDYHHLVLKNYLWVRQLAAINNIAMPEGMDVLIRKALDFAMYVHKPDGLIPSLSDGDSRCFLALLEQGHALYGDEALLYVASRGKHGKPPASRSKAFPDGGYYIVRSGWGNGTEPFEDERYLIFDCGPLGRGNHGHFDLLSFEMAAYGQSMIVDPGRYTYDQSGEINWRVRFRGTAYHNTVMVDKKNQTAYHCDAKKFKIKGPAPDRELKRFASGSGFDYLHGIARSHEYEAVHERKICFVCPEYWIISDFLFAEQSHDYDLLFHLSDQAFQRVSVAVEDDTLLIKAPHLVIAQAHDPKIKLRVEEGYVSRTYGVKHPAPVVRFGCHGTNAVYHTVLYPFKNQGPRISVEALPVKSDSETDCTERTSALCITVTKNGQRVRDYWFTAPGDPGVEYVFGGFRYGGSFLFVRTDSEGKIVRFEGDPGRALLASEMSILGT